MISRNAGGKKHFLIIILLLFLVGNALWFLAAHKRPFLEKEIDPGSMRLETGYAFTIVLSNLNWLYSFKGDDSAEPQKSDLLLWENGALLGPAHAYHEVVRTTGAGAYSHWGKELYFSASDNTDPRTNGRSYKIRVRSGLRFTVTCLFLIFNGVLIVLFMWGVLRRSAVSGAALAGGAAIFLCVLFLMLNLIPVTHWAGRIFYFFAGFFLLLSALFLVFIESRAAGTFSLFDRLFRRLHLSAVILLFALLALESWCRAFPIPDTLAVNPGCRFFWPDWYGYSLNAQGYRERPVFPKTDGVYRILLYGDSYTEGAGVARGDLSGIQLERMLNEKLISEGRGLRVEAFNLGHCGANTQQEAAWIMKDFEELKPDLVVLNYVLNDAESGVPALVESESKITRFLAAFLTGDKGSYLYYRWLRQSPQFFPKTKPGPNAGKNYIELIHEDHQPGWITAKKSLNELKTFLSEREVGFVALVLPLFTPRVTPEMGEVMEKVTFAMTNHGIEAHNLLDYFMTRSDGELLKYAFSPNDSHPNAEGHREIALYLKDLLWNRDDFKALRHSQKNSAELKA